MLSSVTGAVCRAWRPARLVRVSWRRRAGEKCLHWASRELPERNAISRGVVRRASNHQSVTFDSIEDFLHDDHGNAGRAKRERRRYLEALRRGDADVNDASAAEELVRWISGTMLQVATGGEKIDAVNEDYQAHYRALAAVLRRLGIPHPNLFDELWTFYGHWSSELPGYASRREYVTRLYQPVRQALDELGCQSLVEPVADRTTGWPAVDEGVQKLRERYRNARDAGDYRAVGLECTTTLQALGRTVFDPKRHLPAGEAMPSVTDAKRRIGFFVDVLTSGHGNTFAEIRKLVPPTARLAEAVKHAQAPTRVEVGVAADATIQLVNLVRRVAQLESVD